MLLSEIARYWDPWSEFEAMGNSRSSGFSFLSGSDYPGFNVWLGEDDAVVTAEIPGIDPNDVEISVLGTSLTLKGSRCPEEPRDGGLYHRRERWSGDFSRTVDVPFTIDADKVEARFIKGVLYMSLPRAEADKPRKVSVKSE